MEAAQPDAAIEQLRALRAAAASADDRIAVQQQQMKVLMRLGRHDEAVDQARAALADPVLLEDATPRRLVELRFALGSCLLHHRRTAEAMLLLASLRRDFEHDPDPQQRSWFHHDHALALMRSGDLRSAQASVAVALDAAREVGRRRMVAGRLQLAAQLAEPAGRPQEAVNLLDECLLLMADSGGRDDLSEFVRMHRGGMLVLLGRYREALADLAPLHAGATRDPLRRMGTAIGLARLYGQLGQPRQALRLIDAAAAEAAHPWARHQVAVARCELAWRQGEEHGALLEAAAARMPDEPLLQERLQVLRWRAEPDAVDPTLLAERRAHWQAHGFDGHVVFADVLAARRAQRDGDAVAAARQVELALDGLRRHQPLEVCRPWICLTLAQAAAAQPALAQRALRAGIEWLQAVRRFHVPEACRDSFVEGNRVNRALWQAGSVQPG